MQVKIKYSKQSTTSTKDYPYMFQLSLMENSICTATQEGFSVDWKILKKKFIFQKRLIKNTETYTSTLIVPVFFLDMMSIKFVKYFVKTIQITPSCEPFILNWAAYTQFFPEYKTTSKEYMHQ